MKSPITNRTNHQLLVAVTIFLFYFFTFQASAGIFTDNLNDAPGRNFTFENLIKLFGGLACWSMRVAMILIAGAMIIYGLMFLKSRGSPQGMENAKKAFTWGLVGALVIFGVFTIILSVASLVGVDYPIDIIRCG